MDHFLTATHLHLEGKVLLHVLDDHHEEGQLDAERLLGIGRTCDVGRGNIRAQDLEDQTLDFAVGDALDVAIAHLK